MEHVLRQIEISCLPMEIPEFIEVDISELNIGESIHVGDLAAEKYTILSEAERTLVAIAAPRLVAVDTAEEEAEGEEAEAEGEGEGTEEGKAADKKDDEAKE